MVFNPGCQTNALTDIKVVYVVFVIGMSQDMKVDCWPMAIYVTYNVFKTAVMNVISV